MRDCGPFEGATQIGAVRLVDRAAPDKEPHPPVFFMLEGSFRNYMKHLWLNPSGGLAIELTGGFPGG